MTKSDSFWARSTRRAIPAIVFELHGDRPTLYGSVEISEDGIFSYVPTDAQEIPEDGLDDSHRRHP